ncbi:hypothetical protein ACJMK2_027889 [Sinanodonta woodiana]|uniref:Uncharacterized protein n=1 Tax=Sinanodonta woodiana TaxID=1069815 RepID=A0ABD3X5C2_SINWO
MNGDNKDHYRSVARAYEATRSYRDNYDHYRICLPCVCDNTTLSMVTIRIITEYVGRVYLTHDTVNGDNTDHYRICWPCICDNTTLSKVTIRIITEYVGRVYVNTTLSKVTIRIITEYVGRVYVTTRHCQR